MPFDVASSWNSTPSVDWGGTFDAFKNAKPTDYLPYSSERGKYAWGQDPGSSSGDKWGDVLRMAGTALQDYNKQRSGFGDYGQYGGGFGGGVQKVGDLTFAYPMYGPQAPQQSSRGSGLGSLIGTIGGAALGSAIPGVGPGLGATVGSGIGGMFG